MISLAIDHVPTYLLGHNQWQIRLLLLASCVWSGSMGTVVTSVATISITMATVMLSILLLV